MTLSVYVGHYLICHKPFRTITNYVNKCNSCQQSRSTEQVYCWNCGGQLILTKRDDHPVYLSINQVMLGSSPLSRDFVITDNMRRWFSEMFMVHLHCQRYGFDDSVEILTLKQQGRTYNNVRLFDFDVMQRNDKPCDIDINELKQLIDYRQVDIKYGMMIW